MFRRIVQPCGLALLLFALPARAAETASRPYLPVLVLQTGKAVTSRNRVAAHALLIDYSPQTRTFGPVDYGGRAAVWVRGNNSFFFPKKSYQLELQNEDGEDRKASLLEVKP